MKKLNLFLIATILAIFFSGCKQKQQHKNETKASKMEIKKAFADLSPASGSNVTGKIHFKQMGDSIKLTLDAKNIAPGKHALHLHEKGDCSAADASSAGGHWNPTNTKHGKRGGKGAFHKGDIDNFVANKDSTAHFEMTVGGWTIGGDKKSNILGKSVIIHAGADDFTSQPSGAAGKRIACGIIEKKN